MSKGLKGSELDLEPDLESEEKFIEHLESVHHIAVQRDGETSEQSRIRLNRMYPESADEKTCRCPGCKAKRGDIRDALVMEMRK